MIPRIEIKITGDAAARLKDITPRMKTAIAGAMDLENELTVGHIVEQRLTGAGPFPPEQGKLGVRTGRLRRSLRPSKARIVGGTIISAIGSNVKYAGIHETGGKTPPHIIEPRKKGGALRFTGRGGGIVFAAIVKHPGSKIPARRWLSRGIQDRAANYSARIGEAILTTWQDPKAGGNP